MIRSNVVVLFSLLVALPLCAQEAAVRSVAELRQAGGLQLSAAEAKQLLTGATVESTSGVGRKRGFDNSAGGTLYATSEGAQALTPKPYELLATGGCERMAHIASKCLGRRK